MNSPGEYNKLCLYSLKKLRVTMYDFINFPDRRKTESVKWGVYGDDVLPMWVADMDFVSPPPVVKALQERVNHGVFGYPMVMKELKEVVVNRMAARYNWKITEKDLIFVPGVVSAFNLVCQTFTDPGDSVIMQTPIYPPFLGAPANANTEKIEVELRQEKDGRFTIDFDAFENSITDKTRVFMLCNPHNPVGRVFRQEELERLAEICLRHNLVICSDEIHSDLIFSGYHHLPIASLGKEIEQNTITLIAPSKTFNIAGLECSVIICPNEEYRKKLEAARRGLLGSVNVMGLVAGLAAYRDGSEWLKELLIVLENNRDHLVNFIHQRIPEIKVYPPEGTYLAWLDCREMRVSSNAYQFFLENAKVALNDGKEFGLPGEGYLRFNFGCPQRMMEEALLRMEKSLR